jgi:sulfate adenylyltransferase subunit 1 (EFTu-like GTPase family)
MGNRPLCAGQRYLLKHTSQTVQVEVTELNSHINVSTFEPEPAPARLVLNDIGGIRLRTSRPLIYDPYVSNRLLGSFILIDAASNATVAAGMLSAPSEPIETEYTDFAI